MANEARQIDPTRLAEYESAKLLHGSHRNIKQGGCLLEWAAYLAGRPHSDRPPCVAPSIAAFGRSWNDALSEEKRQMLKPYAIRILGTASTPEVENRRAWLAVDWMVREYAPAWLDLAGLNGDSESLRVLPAVNAKSVSNVIAVLGPVKARAAAAGGAAWAAAWDAAGAAAWAKLAPTVERLQASALRLLDRMIAVQP